jgi:hypothetical protein
VIRAAALCLGLLVALPGAARAQAPSTQIAFNAITKAPPGSWAEYLMTKEGEEQTVKVRYTLVSRTAKLMAVELDSTTPMGHMIMRLDFKPDGSEAWKVAKARMKMGAEPVRDMPVPEGEGMGRLAKDASFGELVGREDVAVKAGKFSADRFRTKHVGWTTEVWVDDKLFPVGVVMLKDGQGGKVELVATGKGGKSAL